MGFERVTTFAVNVDRAYLDRWVTPTLSQYGAALWDSGVDVADLRKDFAAKWLGAEEADFALAALEYLDTHGLEHGRPADGGRRLGDARDAISDLVGSSPPEPYRARLRRLLDELEHRTSWEDVEHTEDLKRY